MFSLHGSIAFKIIVHLQHLSDIERVKRRQRPSSERPDGVILLPILSVIGGDIFLLPDVVAFFLPQFKLSPHRTSALSARGRFPLIYQLLAATSLMRTLHSGLAGLDVVAAQRARISRLSETKTEK